MLLPWFLGFCFLDRRIKTALQKLKAATARISPPWKKMKKKTACGSDIPSTPSFFALPPHEGTHHLSSEGLRKIVKEGE